MLRSAVTTIRMDWVSSILHPLKSYLYVCEYTCEPMS